MNYKKDLNTSLFQDSLDNNSQNGSHLECVGETFMFKNNQLTLNDSLEHK